jgi:prepilin-type N-terminal cleavage/methylation domain-containing protein
MMKLAKRWLLDGPGRSQKGLTLIELLLVLGLTGIIGAVATMSIGQVFTSAAISNDQNTAINQVRNAGHWISRDVQMAQTVTPDSGDSGFPLILKWTDYGGDEHRVVYALVGSELNREHYTNYDPVTNPDPDATTFVAQFIDLSPAKTHCDFTDGVFTVTITAEVNGKSETRTFQVMPRPD